MRFDDMLATVLQQPVGDPAARETAWRQIVDLLAQRRIDGDVRLERDAYRRLRTWRPEIAVDVRRAVALSLLGRTIGARLVAFFAEDSLVVARPLITGAQVVPSGWLAILPDLPPTARALMRHRTDLAPEVERGLEAFGAADLVLDAPPPAASDEPETMPEPELAPADTAPPPVAELLARIEAFRTTRQDAPPPPSAASTPEPSEPRADAFDFETGPDGIIRWVAGVPRGPLIGLSIAEPAAAGAAHGVDAHAAGAVRARTRFADARLIVGGAGPAGGDWRISAIARFDPRSGRFLGHRGTGRRPRFEQSAAPIPLAFTAGDDAVRQLVHELRTPLNAITGFAEMIEHGVLGPAGREMRERAGVIAVDARRLAGAIDDLDAAARGEMSSPGDRTDVGAVVGRLTGQLRAAAEARGVVLDVTVPPTTGPVLAGAVGVERMVARLAGAMIGLAARGERIALTFGGAGSETGIAIGRPISLAGRSEAALLDPGYSPDGDWPDAPLLGLGFTLRLVRSLAESGGGALDVHADRLVLHLIAEDAGHANSAGA